MAHATGQAREALPTLPHDVHAPVHAAALAPRPLQVLAATQPPVPLEVVIRWLRKTAGRGVPVRISPLLAQRIAAELEDR